MDLQKDLRTRKGVATDGSIGASSPAAVIGNVLVVGSALHVGMQPPSKVNTPGDIRGFDARTVGAGQVFRVRVGRYATRSAANAAAQDLRTKKIASDAFVTEAEAQ